MSPAWPPQPGDWSVAYAESGSLLEIANSEPASGTLSAGDVVFWFDDDDSAPELHIKAKTADGTLATATIPLTPS